MLFGDYGDKGKPFFLDLGLGFFSAFLVSHFIYLLVFCKNDGGIAAVLFSKWASGSFG